MSQQIEFATRSAPIDSNLDAEIRRWAAEGWVITPGSVGVAVYFLQRSVEIQPGMQSIAGAGLGTLGVDDKQVFILRNGKLMSAAEADLDAATKLKGD